jgi:hypothetical protein
LNEKARQLNIGYESQFVLDDLTAPRFLASTDYDINKFNLLVLQPKTPKGSSISKYKMTPIHVDLNQVNAANIGEWHNQIGEIVSQKLTQCTPSVKKLQALVSKLGV